MLKYVEQLILYVIKKDRKNDRGTVQLESHETPAYLVTLLYLNYLPATCGL